MSEDFDRQAIIDLEHLKLLSLGYMISAAMSAFFSLVGLAYMAMGIFAGEMIAHIPNRAGSDNPPAALFGWLFGGIGLAMFLAMIATAGLKLWAAISIKQRKSRIFCMVVAGLCCLGFPYGTLLGVFSFLVLGRDSVASQFDRARTE